MDYDGYYKNKSIVRTGLLLFWPPVIAMAIFTTYVHVSWWDAGRSAYTSGIMLMIAIVFAVTNPPEDEGRRQLLALHLVFLVIIATGFAFQYGIDYEYIKVMRG